MMLTNMIMSSILSLLNINSNDFSFNSNSFEDILPNQIIVTDQNDLNNTGLFNNDRQFEKVIYYFQSVDLIYEDIYNYTKPNLYKKYSFNSNDYIARERNPIADIFFKNNLWDLAFLSANLFNYMIYNLDDFYYFYAVGLNVAEIFAISSWSVLATTEVNVYTPVFIYIF